MLGEQLDQGVLKTRRILETGRIELESFFLLENSPFWISFTWGILQFGQNVMVITQLKRFSNQII